MFVYQKTSNLYDEYEIHVEPGSKREKDGLEFLESQINPQVLKQFQSLPADTAL